MILIKHLRIRNIYLPWIFVIPVLIELYNVYFKLYRPDTKDIETLFIMLLPIIFLFMIGDFISKQLELVDTLR